MGTPVKIINLIKLCSSNTNCVVWIRGEFSDPFETCKGIRQGDALSPVLFNLTLEIVIRRMPQLQRMEVNRNHTLLAYADVIKTIGGSKQYITNSMSSLMKIDGYVGLSINEKKTKYMYLSRNVREDEDESDLKLDGISF